MRGDPISLPLPVDGDGAPDTGAGAAVRVADYAELALQHHLSGTANITIQVCLQKAPAQWVSLGAPFAALVAGDGVNELPEHAIIWMRALVNAVYTAGDTLTVAAFATRA